MAVAVDLFIIDLRSRASTVNTQARPKPYQSQKVWYLPTDAYRFFAHCGSWWVWARKLCALHALIPGAGTNPHRYLLGGRRVAGNPRSLHGFARRVHAVSNHSTVAHCKAQQGNNMKQPGLLYMVHLSSQFQKDASYL